MPLKNLGLIGPRALGERVNMFMPITYFEGIKRPCNPSGTQPLTFMREREM
jgi:hypothetical protein